MNSNELSISLLSLVDQVYIMLSSSLYPNPASFIQLIFHYQSWKLTLNCREGTDRERNRENDCKCERERESKARGIEGLLG